MNQSFLDTLRAKVQNRRETSLRARYLWLSGQDEARELAPPEGLFDPALPGRVRALLGEEAPEPGGGARLRRLAAELFRQYVGRSLEDLDTARQARLTGSVELVDGTRLSALRARQRLAVEASPNRRRALFEALSGLEASIAGELLAETVKAQFKHARAFGFEGPSALYDGLLDTGLESLDKLALEVLRRTADVYNESCSWLARKRLGKALEDVPACDLPFLFAGPEGLFPAHERDAFVSALCASMQLDPTAEGGIIHDDIERPKRIPASLAFPWRPGERVWLLHRPRGGMTDLRHHLSLLGRCQAWASAERWYNFEDACLEDPAYAESAALTLRGLLCERSFLSKYSEGQAADLAFNSAAAELFALRRAAAELHYELLLYDSDTSEDKDLLYPEVLQTALRVQAPPRAWARNLSAGLPCADAFRGWLLHGMLRQHLLHYFDNDWFHNPRAGLFLRKLWKDDALGSLEDVLTVIDQKQLRANDLVTFFEHAF